MFGFTKKWLSIIVTLALMIGILPSLGGLSYAQGESRTFPETGKTVKGRFLQYWNANGGLAQQGYPISDEMQEKSDTDGKMYTVQYFERAVFEAHPENKAPFDVLLSLLGVFSLNRYHPNGAPDQKANTDYPLKFNETGKTVGGKFRTYWEKNGGLAQQGYPLTDEFQEKNLTDGKTYTVQYFERAVFEIHPENAGKPSEVLLSLLGRFEYDRKYAEAGAQPAVISGAGDIAAVVEQYRTLLGPNNGGEPGSRGSGRREINWDGVPDNLSAPNFLPADFFNDKAAPRARGAFLGTPGDGVQVSADSDNPSYTAVRFGNINPTYIDNFKTFSPERLFSPIGSNVVDMTFFVPGSTTPARVRGFGAVYTDVDQDHTSFEYFDQNGKSLGKFGVPVADKGLSFLGVAFDEPIVARVRIEYGTVALGPDDGPTFDAAVMDDFIYGEPMP